MKIAVTYDNGDVFQHFGHSEFFKIYETDCGSVVKSETVATNGTGHGALAVFLKERGVEALVCGGIGGGAVAALGEAGIRVYAGVSGKADEAVAALLCGRLSYSENANCSHHGHGEKDGGCSSGESGSCSSHGCKH